MSEKKINDVLRKAFILGRRERIAIALDDDKISVNSTGSNASNRFG